MACRMHQNSEEEEEIIITIVQDLARKMEEDTMSGTEAEEDGKKEAERTKAEEEFAVIIVELMAVPGKGMIQGTQRRRAVHVPGMVWAAILGSGTASPKHVWMLRRKPSPTTMTLATPTATFAEATGATDRRRFGQVLSSTEKTPAPYQCPPRFYNLP